jgi:putative FmdB family regulatory protein
MPIYEYNCSQHGKFELFKSMDKRYSAKCPDCKSEVQLVISNANFKMYNPFTKDGEGFSSVTYSPEEANFRRKHNMSKFDKV